MNGRFGPPLVRKSNWEHTWPASREQKIIHHFMLSEIGKELAPIARIDADLILFDIKFYGAEYYE